MTTTEIKELRRLAEAATPGPWDSDYIVAEGVASGDGQQIGRWHEYAVYSASGHAICDTLNRDSTLTDVRDDGDGAYYDKSAEQDCAYIVAACNALPLLLDTINTQAAEIAALRAHLRKANSIRLDAPGGMVQHMMWLAEALRLSEAK